MVTWLAQAGFTGTAVDLTGGMLLQYWLSCGWQRESLTRSLLRGVDTATGGPPAEVHPALLNASARKQVSDRGSA